jgi:hypothetical protein
MKIPKVSAEVLEQRSIEAALNAKKVCKAAEREFENIQRYHCCSLSLPLLLLLRLLLLVHFCCYSFTGGVLRTNP